MTSIAQPWREYMQQWVSMVWGQHTDLRWRLRVNVCKRMLRPTSLQHCERTRRHNTWWWWCRRTWGRGHCGHGLRGHRVTARAHVDGRWGGCGECPLGRRCRRRKYTDLWLHPTTTASLSQHSRGYNAHHRELWGILNGTGSSTEAIVLHWPSQEHNVLDREHCAILSGTGGIIN